MSFSAEMVVEGTVTVVIPVYNGVRFIRRAVDSILGRNLSGNADYRCGRRIEGRDLRDRRIGVLATALRCCAKRTVARPRLGTLVFASQPASTSRFLMQTTGGSRRRSPTQLKVLQQHPDAVGNYTGLRVMSDTGEHLIDLKPVDHTTLWPTLRWCNPGVPPSSVLLRRSFLEELGGGFNERQLGSEDWNLWFRLIPRGLSACVLSL